VREHIHSAASRRALAERLARRATDSPEIIARRLRDAAADMSHYREFDYVIVNDDFARAVSDLRRIVAGRGEDLTSARPELAALLGELLAPAVAKRGAGPLSPDRQAF